jgi:CheY-like chemotaxis protein
MSDALNFRMSDSNNSDTIPANLLGSPGPQEQSSGSPNAGNTAPPTDQPCEETPATSICDAAAQAAEALGNAPDVKAPCPSCVPSPDRRRRRRAMISAPVRVRSVHITDSGPDEISTTVDVSRGGILFLTQNKSFETGMDVAVTFPYSSAPTAIHAEQSGRVARAHEMPEGLFAVAIVIGAGVGEDLVDSCGRKLDEDAVRVCNAPQLVFPKPLVLAVDADDAARESLRNYLTNEGYDAIAVKNGTEAREVLEHSVPALLIAEVEGEGLPGFDLCAFVKSTEKLKKIPVLLTTRTGNPTDYSNAHSLGAVVCMAKPYKQERLGHVVRLLAPPPQILAQNAPAPRPPDPSRRTFNGQCAKPAPPNNGFRRFRFPSFR